jgi:hypothetical protein
MKSTTRLMDYLDGNLNDIEKKVFEKLVNEDADLYKLITVHKEVDLVIEDAELIEFRSVLDEVRNPEKNTRQHNSLDSKMFGNFTKQGNNNISFIVAATFILFFLAFGAGTTAFLTRNPDNQSFSAEQLFEMYYRPYDADIIIRSPGGEYDAHAIALSHYELGNYRSALKIINSYYSSSEEIPDFV